MILSSADFEKKSSFSLKIFREPWVVNNKRVSNG